MRGHEHAHKQPALAFMECVQHGTTQNRRLGILCMVAQKGLHVRKLHGAWKQAVLSRTWTLPQRICPCTCSNELLVGRRQMQGTCPVQQNHKHTTSVVSFSARSQSRTVKFLL
jgi:hypothetical protein